MDPDGAVGAEALRGGSGLMRSTRGSHKLPGLLDGDSTGTFHLVVLDQILTGVSQHN